MSDKQYIVELQDGCWLAPWSGDPGRTCVKESARKYSTIRGAKIALGMARKDPRIHPRRTFLNARINPISTTAEK